MKQKLLLKSMLLLFALIAGSSSVWAVEQVYKSLTFTNADATKKTVYNSFWTETVSTTSWTITNFNNNNWGWTDGGTPALYVIKCGRKYTGSGNNKTLTPSVATITTDAAIDEAITKVVVTLTAINANDYNSIKLYVAPDNTFDANQTTVVDVTSIPTAAGDMTITIPEANRSASRFYKLEFDTKGNTSSNGHTGISKVDYYRNVVSSKTETTLVWSANTYSFYQGDAYTLPTLTPTPAAIANDVTYNSSKTAVASIAANGTVTINGVGQTTITASYAGDATYEAASDACYTLNVLGTYNTMEGVQTGCAAYGTTALPAKITLSDVYVTAVKGNNAYISDGTNGAVIYKSSHGFTAGDKLACSALEMTMLNYNGYTPEITSLTSSTSGLTVTNGQTINPTSLAVDAITTANFGTLVKITNVTYDATNNVFKDASDHTIAYYDNFTANPTLADGEKYDVTGIILFKNSTTVEICPRAAADVEAKTTKTIPTSVWKVGNEEITSVAATKGGTVLATFNTNSTGTKSFESSDETIATVSNTGVITPQNKAGIATITASTAANNDYTVSSATLKVIVGEAVEDGVFNFGNFQDYGSGIVPGDDYYTQASTWSAGGIRLDVSGKYRWFIANTGTPDFRFYTNETNSLTFTAPNGYYITSISGLSTSLKYNDTNLSSTTWSGKSQTVILTTTGAVTLSKITVYYSEPTISVTLPAAGWMTYCNVGAALDFTGIKAYKVSAVGETSVTLEEITAAPANTPVILEATEGSHNLSVVASADAVGTNKLRVSDGTKTTTDTKIVYALAKKNDVVGFYKVKAGVNVPDGKCYIEVNAPTSAPEFLGFGIDGNITGIDVVKNEVVKGQLFDLQGRKVANPTKGLYIVNGKKVVIK